MSSITNGLSNVTTTVTTTVSNSAENFSNMPDTRKTTTVLKTAAAAGVAAVAIGGLPLTAAVAAGTFIYQTAGSYALTDKISDTMQDYQVKKDLEKNAKTYGEAVSEYFGSWSDWWNSSPKAEDKAAKEAVQQKYDEARAKRQEYKRSPEAQAVIDKYKKK